MGSPLKLPEVVKEVIKPVEPVNDESMSPSKKRPLAEISTQAEIAPEHRNLLQQKTVAGGPPKKSFASFKMKKRSEAAQ